MEAEPAGHPPPGVRLTLVLLPGALLAAFMVLGAFVDPVFDNAVKLQGGFACLVVYAAVLIACALRGERARLLLVWGQFLLVGLVFQLGVIDDALISLRYARNFASGQGLVFNAGEYVEGYTSFSWVFGLGIFERLVRSARLPLVAYVASIASGLLVLWLAHSTARMSAPSEGRESRLVPLATLLLMGANFPLLFWSFSGMETSFYLALILASSLFFLRYLQGVRAQRSLWIAAYLLTLACLTRPETLLIYAGHLPFIGLRERRLLSRRVLQFVLPGIVCLIPYVLWRIGYYGFPLPNTYYAKVGGPFEHALFGLDYLVRGGLAHLVVLSLVILKLVRVRFRPGLTDGFLVAMVGLWATVVVITGADHFSEWRYFVYMLPYLCVLAAGEVVRLTGNALASGAPEAASGAPEAASGAPEAASAASEAVTGASWWKRVRRGQGLAAVAVLAFLLPFYFQGVGPLSVQYFGVREAERWAEVGQWMERNKGPDDVIAAPVIGAIGFHTTGTLVDMVGLADSVIARAPVPAGGPKDHERFDTDYVLGRTPALIYLLSGEEDEAAFLRTPHWVPAIEDLKRRFPHPDYGYRVVSAPSGPFAVYQRRR